MLCRCRCRCSRRPASVAPACRALGQPASFSASIPGGGGEREQNNWPEPQRPQPGHDHRLVARPLPAPVPILALARLIPETHGATLGPLGDQAAWYTSIVGPRLVGSCRSGVWLRSILGTMA
jgi:hypothetical protein